MILFVVGVHCREVVVSYAWGRITGSRGAKEQRSKGSFSTVLTTLINKIAIVKSQYKLPKNGDQTMHAIAAMAPAATTAEVMTRASVLIESPAESHPSSRTEKSMTVPPDPSQESAGSHPSVGLKEEPDCTLEETCTDTLLEVESTV